jgi:hypothetical protein
MRKFCALVVLTLSLAVFAYADDGHMGTMEAPPPPPTPTGHMDTPLTSMAVTIIESVLSLA